MKKSTLPNDSLVMDSRGKKRVERKIVAKHSTTANSGLSRTRLNENEASWDSWTLLSSQHYPDRPA